MKRYIAGLLITLFSLTICAGTAPTQPESEYGPAKGALVIVGGGTGETYGIPQKFIELAGGPSANFVIIPTAEGNKNPDGSIVVY